MIVIATIGATMTMPIAPRLPVLTATAAEQPMTSKQTSEPTINHAADEAGAAGAATTRSQGRLRSSSMLPPQPQERPLPQPHLPAGAPPQSQVPVAVGAIG